MDTTKEGKAKQSKDVIQCEKEAPRITRVLPIVGLDVGAISCISPSALVGTEGTLLNIRINF